MLRMLLASTAVALVATASQAADLPRGRAPAPAPVAAPVFTWTGFYVGANAGYAGDKFRYPLSVDGGEIAGQASVNSSGFLGGAQIGYNWQFANGVMIGAEADYAFANVEGKANLGLDDRLSAEIGGELTGLGTVRARLGYGFDRTLFYVTGGWAYGRVKSSASLGFGGEGGSISRSVTMNGWTVGAGVEYAFTNQISFKTEYLFVDLGDKNLYRGDGDGFLGGARLGVDSRLHVVRAGVNYRF